MSSANPLKTEHALELLDSMQKMRSSESICDFTIKVGDERLCVHKTVVAASAPYFLAMFTSKLKEENEGEVDMKDAQPFAVKLVIDYMYTGEVNLDANSVQAVLQTADLMQMLRLKDVCFRYLVDNITTENCFEVKRLAKLYSSPQFADKAEEYIEKHFTDLPESDDFLDLTLDEMQRYAENSGRKSLDVWKTVTAWVRHDAGERTQHFHQLLKSFYLHFNFKFLFQTALEDPLVKSCEESRSLLLGRLFSTKNTTNYNCFKIYDLAKEYDASHADNCQTMKVLAYISGQLPNIRYDPGLKRLTKDHMAYIVTGNPRNYGSAWEGIVNWCSSHEEDMLDMLKAIKLESRPLDFLLNPVWINDLIKRRKDCRDHVADHILSRKEALQINGFNYFLLNEVSQSRKHPKSVQVKYAVHEYMSQNISQVFKYSSFERIPKDDVWTMFKRSPSLGKASQLMCDAALRWVSFNVTERKQELPDLLGAIDLSPVTMEGMRKLRQHRLVSESPECMELITDNLLTRFK